MAKLMDLEELLYEVKNKELIPILREAVACYHVSSFRACIILSFNALVDDLLIKLKSFKEVNEEGKKIYEHVNALIEGQSSFETPLIEQLVKAKIFTDLDGELYKTFQKFRHKSAHPSGYAPTAECARFIYTEIIKQFLSKETLLTSDRVDSLLSDIGEDYFFTSSQIKERAEIARDEISNIHPDAYAQMVNKTYKKAVASGEDKVNNYVSFLCALFYLNKPPINELIIKLVIKKNISKGNHTHLFTSLVSCNPSAFDHTENTLSLKILANLKDRMKIAPQNIGNYVLANPYYSFMKVCNEGNGALKDLIVKSLSVFIENPSRLCVFLHKIDKAEGYLGHPAYIEIRNIITEVLIGTSSKKVDEILTAFIEDEMKCLNGFSTQSLFEICCAIVINNSKSVVAEKIAEDKFEQLRYVLDKTKKYFRSGKFSKDSLIHKMSESDKALLDEIYF